MLINEKDLIYIYILYLLLKEAKYLNLSLVKRHFFYFILFYFIIF